MKLSTAKTILKYTKEYVDLTGVRVAQVKNGFYYFPAERGIAVGLEKDHEDELWEEWMVEYLKDEFDFEIKKEHMEIFSLLHEVGHHVVGDVCTPEEYHMLTNQIDEGDLYEYRQIPDEYQADKFAVKFLCEHLEAILELL